MPPAAVPLVFRAWSAVLVVCSFACANAQPPRPVMEMDLPATSTVVPVSARVDIPLDLQKPALVGHTGITATLTESRQSRFQGADGRTGERTSGTLRLQIGDQVTEQAFESGRAFEAYGMPMAVFGTPGWLELSVFPPGESVRP